MIFLFCTLLLSGCWIEDVSEDESEPPDTTTVFEDVSESNIPGDELDDSSMDAKAVDVDGDGDLDLVIAVEFFPNKILINDGNGVFTDESDSRLPGRDFDTEDIAIADFDGNGSPDIFFASEDNQTNEFYLNNSDGTFTDASDRIPVTGTSNAVITADLNNDDLPDLIIGNYGQNAVLINSGDGFFTDQSASRLPQTITITQDLTLGDIDSDSDLDLLEANEDNNQLFLNTGSGFFTNRTQTRLPLTQGIEETRDVNLADVDGDNDPDLYFGNVIIFQDATTNQDRLLVNNQGSYNDATQSQLPSMNSNTFDADFFDIDRDGDLDIIAGDFGDIQENTGNFNGNNLTRILINDGSGFFDDQTTDFLPDNFSPKVVDFEIADFNGDGLLDIYVANFRSRDVLLLQDLS